MEESYHPAGYDYRSRYSDLSMYRGFEGGSVYVARGENDWVIITSESTILEFLSDVDRADLAEKAVHIYSFTSQSERDEFVAAVFSVHPNKDD